VIQYLKMYLIYICDIFDFIYACINTSAKLTPYIDKTSQPSVAFVTIQHYKPQAKDSFIQETVSYASKFDHITMNTSAEGM